jgi:hypothetical protein
MEKRGQVPRTGQLHKVYPELPSSPPGSPTRPRGADLSSFFGHGNLEWFGRLSVEFPSCEVKCHHEFPYKFVLCTLFFCKTPKHSHDSPLRATDAAGEKSFMGNTEHTGIVGGGDLAFV